MCAVVYLRSLGQWAVLAGSGYVEFCCDFFNQEVWVMRCWILLAAFVVAEAIKPGHEYDTVLSMFVIIAFVSGMVFDVVELRDRN